MLPLLVPMLICLAKINPELLVSQDEVQFSLHMKLVAPNVGHGCSAALFLEILSLPSCCLFPSLPLLWVSTCLLRTLMVLGFGFGDWQRLTSFVSLQRHTSVYVDISVMLWPLLKRVMNALTSSLVVCLLDTLVWVTQCPKF